MKGAIIYISFILFGCILMTSCKQMSCAGIMTYPRCAKFCTHGAVATCEASVQRSLDQLNTNFQRNLNSGRNDHDHEPGIYESVYGCPMSNPGCKD